MTDLCRIYFPLRTCLLGCIYAGIAPPPSAPHDLLVVVVVSTFQPTLSPVGKPSSRNRHSRRPTSLVRYEQARDIYSIADPR